MLAKRNQYSQQLTQSAWLGSAAAEAWTGKNMTKWITHLIENSSFWQICCLFPYGWFANFLDFSLHFSPPVFLHPQNFTGSSSTEKNCPSLMIGLQIWKEIKCPLCSHLVLPMIARLGNKDLTTRSNFCKFSKLLAPGLYFCTQFWMRTRRNLLLTRSKFAPCSHLFPSLMIAIIHNTSKSVDNSHFMTTYIWYSL